MTSDDADFDGLPSQELSNLKKTQQLNSLLELGHKCANLMSATCVSEQLSKSYNEQSLRFTCQNGHNFFLSVRKLQETFTTLSSRSLNELSQSELNSLSWCNKCTKFYARVKTFATKKLRLNLLGGLFQKRILLSCKNSNHHFSISYNKKFEQISCLKCRLESKELHKDKLRREEELYRETLRND